MAGHARPLRRSVHLKHEGLAPHEVAHSLEHHSGLLGPAGSVAAMTVSLSALEALVFTGSAGEREPDIDISSGDADVRTLVIASREDLEITAGVEQA